MARWLIPVFMLLGAMALASGSPPVQFLAIVGAVFALLFVSARSMRYGGTTSGGFPPADTGSHAAGHGGGDCAPGGGGDSGGACNP